jgi:hypothetical protein
VKRSYTFNGLMSAVALLLPLTAATESQLRSEAPSASLSATAQINFKIVIPKALFLQVGREGVILRTGARKGIASEPLCTSSGESGLAGSRLVCTASMP